MITLKYKGAVYTNGLLMCYCLTFYVSIMNQSVDMPEMLLRLAFMLLFTMKTANMNAQGTLKINKIKNVNLTKNKLAD